MLNMKNFIDTGLILWAFIQRQLEKLLKYLSQWREKKAFNFVLVYCLFYTKFYSLYLHNK